MDDIRQVNIRGTLYNITSTANINMAPIENGDTASQAYSINKLLVFKGHLCKATSAIAQGDTLAVGTNLDYDTIAEEIEGLSDGIGGTTDTFRFGTDGNGDYGYIKKVAGADTFFPFRTKHTETYKPTARSASNDMGEYHKKRYVDTTAVPNTNSGTYKPTARQNNNDMGATNTYRYVDTTAVPNTNSGTYSVTSNGTKDMGATNTYRYVNVNVQTKGSLVYASNTDPYPGAYNQGTIAINLTAYNSAILQISGLYNGDAKKIYLEKGQSIAVGDWNGTSGGGRGYEFLADGSGIKETIGGNSYGAWGTQFVSAVWAFPGTLI